MQLKRCRTLAYEAEPYTSLAPGVVWEPEWNGLLRGERGFDGHVVSDCVPLGDFHLQHNPL